MNTNNALMQRRHNAVPRGVGQIHPIFAERAENCRVWDVEGREYLDFAGGIAVLNTGHLHPGIVSAVEAQLKKLSHTCFQVLAYEPYLALCERMNQKVPGDFAKKTLLVTTGSEAVENAVKIARAATKRSGAIAFSGAYHGRTHYTLSLTGKVHPYSAGMGLMPGHVSARFILARYTTSATTTRSPALNASLKMMPRRKISPPLLLSRYRAKADFTPPLPRLCSDCARYATNTALC